MSSEESEFNTVILELFSQEYNFDVDDFEQPFKLQTKILEIFEIDTKNLLKLKDNPT